jgi:acetyl esterase/lipase
MREIPIEPADAGEYRPDRKLPRADPDHRNHSSGEAMSAVVTLDGTSLRALDLAGLPPAIIHTAELAPVRDEGNAHAERLAHVGVAVDHSCHDGMVHNFHAIGAVLPQAADVLARIGEQVRLVLGRANTN